MEHGKLLFDLIKNNKFDEFIEYFKKEENIDVNLRDDTGNYLITYAIIKNNINIVKLLLTKGSLIDITDQEGRSLLYLPIKYGYNDIIKLLIDHDVKSVGISIIDSKDTYSNIPLHYSIFFKNIYAINILIEANSNPNTTDENGNNSLHLAIYTRNYDICKLILDTDININARTLIGETALHIACNFQLENIVKLLVSNSIDINAQDYNNEITALIYAVNLNNKNISNYLIDNGADPNIQDFLGNTALHYAIIEEAYQIVHDLLTSKKVSTKLNVNIHNISSKLPIHLLLEKDVVPENNIINLLMSASNLNFQDDIGNTPLHLICEKNIWKNYKDILVKKKLNIFIKNYEDKAPINYINEKDFNEFIDLITKSYLYVIRHYNFLWEDDWENICNKELFYDKLTKDEAIIINKYIKEVEKNKDICYNLVKNKLINISKNNNASCKNSSFPKKKTKKCIQINDIDNIEFCNFVGITFDILMGLIYLLQKHVYACSTLTKNFMINNDLCNYFLNIGIKTNTKCEFLNFEIVWIHKKLFFSENFVSNFKKCLMDNKIRFIVVPLGIELKEGSHANYLIFDKKTYEIERFEPYGSNPPYKFNYNKHLLDNVLTFKFNEIDERIKYISPDQFLPKIGFQYFDIYESKTKKIGDPGGFCALWSIWYTDMRLQYPEIERTSLVNKLLKEIKRKNISFRNLIRNYSTNITKIRDEILAKSNITINDWLNDEYTEEQFKKIIEEITKLLNKHIK